MLASLRWLLVPALLAGAIGLLVPADAGAFGPPDGFRVKDEGKFFSNDAIEKAEKVISAIKRESNEDLLVETYAHPPDSLKPEYQKMVADQGKEKGQAAFFQRWAEGRYKKADVRGVLILLSKNPRYIEVMAGQKEEKKAFTPADERATRDVLVKSFNGDNFDAGLVAAVEHVRDTLKAHGVKATTSPTTKVTRSNPTTTNEIAKEASAMPIAGWICIGLGVLLALWVVVGIFKGLSGAGRQPGAYAQGGPQQGNFGPGGPPPGYIPPPGGGGYGGGYGAPAGGGGGGFMKGMLGGMLGGAAGMWAYDRFFRGDSGGYGGGGMTPPAYGGGAGTGGAADPGGAASPGDAPGTGAGGTWGSGDAGNDWGSTPADTGGGGDAGGGGDWGGGGDTGGGGDWGGGGGDAGGGGDWGGGGGDAGGGGDWGGGGGGDGGGDW